MESLKREDWIIVIVNSACETAIVYKIADRKPRL